MKHMTISSNAGPVSASTNKALAQHCPDNVCLLYMYLWTIMMILGGDVLLLYFDCKIRAIFYIYSGSIISNYGHICDGQHKLLIDVIITVT